MNALIACLLRAANRRREAVSISGVLGVVRGSPWLSAGTVCGWAAAVGLVVAIGHVGTLVLVLPPAVIATVPLLAGERRVWPVGLLVAIVLVLWAGVGITLLGSYFLPSAVLIAIGAVRGRKRQHGPA